MFRRILRFFKEKVLNLDIFKLDIFFKKKFILFSGLFFLATLLTFSINTIFIKNVLDNLDIEKLGPKSFFAYKRLGVNRSFDLNSIQRNIFDKDGIIPDLRQSSSVCQVQEIT